jgi:hypothetical protein
MDDRTMLYLHSMQPFPIRVLNGDWQVLTKRHHWTNCKNHRQADILSHSTQLVNDAATSRRNGIAFSAELEATAKVMDQIGLPGAALCRFYAAGNTASENTEWAQGKPR